MHCAKPLAHDFKLVAAAAGLALALAGCGGGGGGSTSAVTPAAAPVVTVAAVQPGGLSEAVAGHLDRLNEVRAAMGMNALAWNGPLQAAAAHHATFLTANQVFGHAEWSSGAAYYAAGIGDRAALAGYPGSMVGEVVVGTTAYTAQDGRNLMDMALASPGHRSVLLAPEIRDIGIANSPLVTEVGASQTNWVAPDALFTYPYAGQNNVLTVFAPQDEVPNPLPGVAETGMPLSVHTRLFGSFVVRGGSLRNAQTGADVELLPNPDLGQSRSAFIFYPKARLEPNTAYVFTVDCDIASKSRRLTTAFTTGKI